MRDVRVASVQFEHAAQDKKANIAKIKSFAERAAKQSVQIIVFPECCVTGYWFLRKLSRDELRGIAEPVFNGPSSQALMALAKKHSMTIGAGLLEIADDLCGCNAQWAVSTAPQDALLYQRAPIVWIGVYCI